MKQTLGNLLLLPTQVYFALLGYSSSTHPWKKVSLIQPKCLSRHPFQRIPWMQLMRRERNYYGKFYFSEKHS